PPRRCSLIAAYHEWATGRCLRVLRNSGSRRQCWHSSQMLAYGSSEVGCASTPSQVRCVGRPATGWPRLLASSAFPSGLAIGARRRTGSAPLSSIRRDSEQNTFVESLGGKDVDASLLLLQEIGFVAASDPRFLGTIAAVEKRLRNGSHIFRYSAPDDFGAPTVAFTVCTL